MHSAHLHQHPTTPLAAVHELTVGIHWQRTMLALHYRLRAAMDQLCIPPPAPAQHTDELWQHTCFELFASASGVAGYCEFNFSPGGPWAAYRFDGYRLGMRNLQIDAPCITASLTATQLDVRVEVALGSVPWFAGVEELRCGLTAVIETRSGARAFCALQHAAAQPDFHHPDSFVLRLPLARD
jgi:hypothetical protein